MPVAVFDALAADHCNVNASGVSAVANTTLNLSKAVSATDGLQVVVSHNAPVEMQSAAANRTDPALKDIVPAPPPFTPEPAKRLPM